MVSVQRMVTARGTTRRRHARMGSALGAIGFGALTVLAAQADSEKPRASVWLTTMDVAVGLAFVAVGLLAPGPRRQRALFAAVGVAWLVASFAPDTSLLHQTLLVAALVAFPTGRPRGLAGWVLVCLAVPVAPLLFSQLAIAVLFAAVAAWSSVSGRTDPVARWYPSAAAAAVAAVLALWWSAERLSPSSFDDSLWLLVYEVVLLGVAIGFPIAANAVIVRRTRVVDQLLSGERLIGLEGVGAVLGDALGDPGLRVYRWRSAHAGYDDGRGQMVSTEGTGRRWLYVNDESRPVAAVAHLSAALDDPPTAAAVSIAVRLALVNVQLQHELDVQLGDLEAARLRVVAAADRQRTAMAARLSDEVVRPLERATNELRTIGSTNADADGAHALRVVVEELSAATNDIASLVAGVPPARLGGGRLRHALAGLAGRIPVPTTVLSAPALGCDPDTETALFYVCSEALVNAVKHADASRIDIAITGGADAVAVSVADDGRGGADASGSGLQGLADRLASRGGRLQVDSPPGAGTIVTATIPR